MHDTFNGRIFCILFDISLDIPCLKKIGGHPFDKHTETFDCIPCIMVLFLHLACRALISATSARHLTLNFDLLSHSKFVHATEGQTARWKESQV